MPPNDPSSPSRRVLPQPVETSPKVRRRFAPEPVETSSKSNRKAKDQSEDHTAPPVRRFLPQPIETSSKSSKQAESHDDVGGTSPRRPLPQPIESSVTSTRPRKFAPQLMETTRRSRKSTDLLPALSPSDKTDEPTPADLSFLPKHMRPSPVPPVNSPVTSSDHVPQLHESHFSSAALSKRTPRRHSFRVPELARIASSESEGSEESKVPSSSTSPSAKTEETEPYKHATRIRESVDDQSSGYLLSLAAKAAERQLREQVLAAYPNEHDYEPVDHFAIDRDSDRSDVEGAETIDGRDGRKSAHYKRESATGRDGAEMRQHPNVLGHPKKDQKDAERLGLDRRKSTKGTVEIAEHDRTKALRTGHKGEDKQEWKIMRKAASPPMAGEHLKFPKCQTPRQTRLDVASYPAAKRTSGTTTPTEYTGLWTPSQRTSQQRSNSGLWMGVCVASVQSALESPNPIQSGLLTPSEEREDPFATTTKPTDQLLPPSPPSSLEGKGNCIETVLQVEQEIDREFSDTFITQIYNYLSLGYPSLARKYDGELSKITKISIDNLRRDDSRTNAKGYVGAPEGSGSDVRGMQEGQCERWCALRTYVREWARQQPNMVSRAAAANEDWGARARKGSWAI
ncbi:MAG: hypothetical protein HETSPECPRED_008016 [Heterodermia speciosa]|uniref:Uncharacterized protein n=1 Tax=Heterodermia speciosa TaxID=116794 RepID=A0A8H3EK66_9LECA|nr:MAG: hypothetical protein HETSPECPRED_008016 [Heterodermia speciosa]